MACLHLAQEGHSLYPEHFLNEAQLQKKAEGKLRYMPGPTSVIESALQIGFIGRKEQTGHKAQKPADVYRRLIEMATEARRPEYSIRWQGLVLQALWPVRRDDEP